MSRRGDGVAVKAGRIGVALAALALGLATASCTPTAATSAGSPSARSTPAHSSSSGPSPAESVGSGSAGSASGRSGSGPDASGSGRATASPADAGPDSHWRPGFGLRWQVQLSGGFDPSVPADVYDVDGAEVSASAVRSAKDSGAHLVCYFNAGAWEEWRSDAGDFPAEVIGAGLDGWPGEHWLDVRRQDVLLPLMAKRLDECRAKGFDAVDPDNVDGYQNHSGFDLTSQDQVAYLRALIGMAHDRGLAFGLKNGLDLVPSLADEIDFAVNEQCHEYDECAAYAPLLERGKPVVVLEYGIPARQACADVPEGMEVLLKDLDLGPARTTC